MSSTLPKLSLARMHAHTHKPHTHTHTHKPHTHTHTHTMTLTTASHPLDGTISVTSDSLNHTELLKMNVIKRVVTHLLLSMSCQNDLSHDTLHWYGLLKQWHTSTAPNAAFHCSQCCLPQVSSSSSSHPLLLYSVTTFTSCLQPFLSCAN